MKQAEAEQCCESMRYWVNHTCEAHPNKFDCPDALLHFDARDRTYGLIIHDGGTSVIEIKFCPWCATDLGVV